MLGSGPGQSLGGLSFDHQILMIARLVLLLVILLNLGQLALAQEPKGRDALIKQSIANLDSKDIPVAAQAAIDLGILRATEGVPAMLRVLESSRVLLQTKHIMPKDKDRLSYQVVIDVKAEIISSLGKIGDKRAVPVLKKYLEKPLTNGEVFTGNVAHALYQITGQLFEYKDYDGVDKLYAPGPIAEEEFRKTSRPDLKATEGLTASLEIEAHHPTGNYWVGDRALVIELVIRNQSKRVIEIDVSNDNFRFSSVAGSGERLITPANLLSSLETVVRPAVIKPGEKLRLRWLVERLNASPLSRGWLAYVNIKCIYTNPLKNHRGTMWRGERLVSNSVERFYFAVE